jgi:hypothetical protein
MNDKEQSTLLEYIANKLGTDYKVRTNKIVQLDSNGKIKKILTLNQAYALLPPSDDMQTRRTGWHKKFAAFRFKL